MRGWTWSVLVEGAVALAALDTFSLPHIITWLFSLTLAPRCECLESEQREGRHIFTIPRGQLRTPTAI